MSPSPQQDVVKFSTTGASIAGSLSGVVMAVAVPWVVLTQGQVLGAGTQTTLVWVAVIVGGLISLTSAFFGLVMPSQVGGMAPGLDEDGRRPHAEASAAAPAQPK